MAISTSTHHRVHERSILIDELQAFAADREQHGKALRATNALLAARELAEGAERVFFERCYYVVGPEGDRYTAYAGTRAEVLAELEDAGRGAVHMGAAGLAQQAARAVAQVESGETRVRVGDLVYEVVS